MVLRVGWRADDRRLFERTIRTTGEDQANFATALEMLVVKAFGDMGQTARLRLIRDRFIAGHNSCDLCRHLDSAPPETPIRGVVDRCRVWESHADTAISRTRKPTTDPTYPAFTVGETDSNNEITESEAGDSRYTRTVATAVEGISTEYTGTDVEVVIRWTATTAATASAAVTTAPRLDRCDLFFMWTIGTYGDALP